MASTTPAINAPLVLDDDAVELALDVSLGACVGADATITVVFGLWGPMYITSKDELSS
jgi:hypothetical protein